MSSFVTDRSNVLETLSVLGLENYYLTNWLSRNPQKSRIAILEQNCIIGWSQNANHNPRIARRNGSESPPIFVTQFMRALYGIKSVLSERNLPAEDT
jgi:hypothetical protein